MSEMIDQVARVIGDKFSPAIDLRAPYAKIMVAEAALGAIAAMRALTWEMREAGAALVGGGANAEDCWRAMIDAALAEDKP